MSDQPPVVGDELPDDLRPVARRLIEYLEGAGETAPTELSVPGLLRSLHALGYRVTMAPTGEPARRGVWSGADSEAGDFEAARRRAEEILRTGEPLLAFNLAEEALQQWPDELRLRQLRGLALARSGAVDRANQAFQELADEGHDDGETLGILGRTHKDLAVQARDESVRRQHLDAAFRSYERAYLAARKRGQAGEIYYTGINAATVALLLGRQDRSRELAAHVDAVCSRELAEQGEGSRGAYWLFATLGEAALIEGDLERAQRHYGRASQLAGLRFGDLASTRRQARLLLEAMGQDRHRLDEVLTVPAVLVYSGHMIDAPDRPEPRFPPRLEGAVAEEIGRRLDRLRPAAAYGSAACGADILVLEAMIERGGEVHVVLPFPPEDFRTVSVEVSPAGDWGGRFERVLEAASSVTVSSDHYASGSGSTFHYANLILTGMAELRCRALDTELVPLAIWDGGPAGGPGGTASLVEHWRAQGHEVEHIDLRRMNGLPPLPSPLSSEPQPEQLGDEGFQHVMRALLFADATGYSKLTEDQIPLFVAHFMGAIAKLTHASERPPLLMETAGDGLYYVFAEPGAAGQFALELSDLINDTDWGDCGLPESLNMRVALHCGPVYTCIDPVTRLRKYTGPHTSRTARIEPITPPGQVYASSGFAAVAAATGVKELEFDYIGHTSLAKKYGSLALYHVRRAD